MLHALNATLLLALLRRSGVPFAAAGLAGAIFAVHPANVEAVAWISQLKSVTALGFSLGALLAFRRHPLGSAALFTLALLAKGSALFALPMAAALAWAWRGSAVLRTRHGLGLALWMLATVLYAIPQLGAFQNLAPAYEDPYADAATQLRSMVAIGARYLAMAATGYGTSAFHEPAAVKSGSDPWWLAGLILAPLLAWRIVVTLRRRREEAAYWLGAATAFAPISQIVPFFFGMADRYLYFMLPGLLGGALLFGKDIRARFAARAGSGSRLTRHLPALNRAALSFGLLLTLVLALQAEGRAGLWTGDIPLLADAASQYPDGSSAHYLRALLAMRGGDPDSAVEELRGAAAHGYHLTRTYSGDPLLIPLQDHPGFQQLIHEIAGLQLEHARNRGFSTQRQLHAMAWAHVYRGELDDAVDILERAIHKGGPLDSVLQRELEAVRRERAARRGGRAASDNPFRAVLEIHEQIERARSVEPLGSGG